MGRNATISLCTIVRNEAANLAACLQPVVGLFHEIVVVDTGSRDDTRRIAADLGARVFDFAWCDDFSAARNESLARATGQWAMWLDADDRVDPLNVERLRRALSELPPDNTALVMQCRSTPLNTAEPAAIMDQVRLFRRTPEIRWEGRVHEQVVPCLQRHGHRLVRCDVEIAHIGYQDEAAVRRKANRDLRLLNLDYLTAPDNPATLYHLATCCLRLGDRRQAIEHLQRGLECDTLSPTFRRKALAMLADAHWGLGEIGPALQATAHGLGEFPDDEELLLKRADYLLQTGDPSGAEKCLVQILRQAPSAHLKIGLPEGIRDRIAPRELAVVYMAVGHYQPAEALLRQVLGKYPDQVFAWVHLGTLLTNQGRWAELAQVLESLRAAPGGEVYALAMEAQSLLKQGRLARVRPLLEAAMAKAPHMIWPRRLLTVWLEACGAAVEERLAAERDILRIAPGDARARQRSAELERLAGQPAAEPLSV